ncbi:MAG: 3-phosphoserine/phosphohydroxythreonine transaminase [Deltaproteobacteria bacterium]|nr:3-phosphoserine/phosphohydroxythreonine transaminase [Deltaproteobacteria bacterium]
MKYDRIHNFAAGPAVLPLSVVEKLAEQLPNLKGTGIGLMEISHRSKTFDAVVRSAQARLRRILSIPDDYEILFLQGGASLQFIMAPMNLLERGDKIDFLNTGVWSKKAIKEAALVGDVRVAYDGSVHNFAHVCTDDEYTVRPDAKVLHYTTNNTIYGTEFFRTPKSDGLPLVSDMSSDIASRPVEVGKHHLIYAGAQKNLGPSGVTVVILKKEILERVPSGLPSMLDYRTHVKEQSLFNTPCTIGIYVVDEILGWIEDFGGLEAVARNNEAKAARIYTELDRSDFWKPHAEPESRSRMNITWRIHDPTLEETFLAEAAQAGFSGLKGHRSVGGIRASVYNYCPMESVDALVAFMTDFERRHG